MPLSRVNHHEPHDFSLRHIGPRPPEVRQMLASLGYDSLDALADAAVPAAIRLNRELNLPAPLSEHAALQEIKQLAGQNKVLRSWIGMGYANCVVPPVIKRNILENPGWYTQYTPYQPEISQGRLEALLNFQTMVSEMTGLPIANASLLDEGTAAAEAMALSHAVKNRDGSKAFFIAATCHPQVLEVVKGRAEALAIDVIVGDPQRFDFKSAVFGVLLPYPDTKGELHSYRSFIELAHQKDALVTMAVDLLALALLVPPGELGADIAIGNSQRFGVPLGYGGPHAAFFATKEEHKRRVPGRIVGVSKDRQGRRAFRLALQTREQHIRREKATSNICTAQALLANMAGMYAVYHGREGITAIAERVAAMTGLFAAGVQGLGVKLNNAAYFDTLNLGFPRQDARFYWQKAQEAGINLRLFSDAELGVSFDETTSEADVEALLGVFAGEGSTPPAMASLWPQLKAGIPPALSRKSAFLTHPIFERYRSETELMRYLKRLEQKDLSLTSSMIPLGSCTMKLNAASELEPISWPEFAGLHPFAPPGQAAGYRQLFSELESMLAEVTGYAAVSLQPNSGAQGEYAGLLVIKAYHQARGEGHRKVCLIPSSAHGTNPASAAMAGYQVVAVSCDKQGNIDLGDLKAKANEHSDKLAAIMVTYPSTHGVFEAEIKQICELIHAHGGQVYLDGANLNAQLGLCAPGAFGADVSHLNLHKTFCIPHGGGGPGMGPIAVGAHLAPYLPGHPVVQTGGEEAIKAVAAAPWGSAGILPIPWMYMRMMGAAGLKRATQTAILNANYIAHRLAPHYPILYRGSSGLVAHECIIDIRPIKATSGVEVVDIAKRLMDYGYHSPTMAFPVAGTMMIEPTESESLAELERFCTAMIAIRHEIAEIEAGRSDRQVNLLKNAPHTASELCGDAWDLPYSRQQAAFPAAWLHEHKYWPSVGRLDEAYGDRYFFCTCPAVEEWAVGGPNPHGA